jgi:hypothetical protein
VRPDCVVPFDVHHDRVVGVDGFVEDVIELLRLFGRGVTNSNPVSFETGRACCEPIPFEDENSCS